MKLVCIHDLMVSSGVSFGTSGIRGLVVNMSEELCYAYTAAFLQAVSGSAERIVLGYDLRPSSPRIAAACAAAIQGSGLQVIFSDSLPTPALAYYASQLGVPALVVTGSHIPFDRNGIKFYRATGEISKVDEQAILNALVDVPEVMNPIVLPAADSHARDAYVQRYLDFFGAGALVGKRVAVYEHSSVARDVLRDILQGLGAEVVSLGRTDTFVPMDTEAVRPEDVAQAKRWADTYEFDAIVSTDGDGDRPLIGDERGQWLRGDLVGLLCAKYLHAQVVVTPLNSNTALEKSGLFTHVIRTKIGSPYVISGMDGQAHQESRVVVGYEANGGFLLGSDIVRNGKKLGALPTRDAVLPILALLCMANERGCTLSELANDLPPRYTASDRLQNFPLTESLQLISKLSDDRTFAAQILAPDSGCVTDTDFTDGLRIMFDNGDIVHLRPSGNAPELRCYVEAESQNHAQQLCDNCLHRLEALV